jgi:HEAT repeat protein
MKRRYAEWVLALAGVAAIVVIWTVSFRGDGTAGEPVPFESGRCTPESCDSATEEMLRTTVREAGLEAIPVLLNRIQQQRAPLGKTVSALSSLGPSAVSRLLTYFDDQDDNVRLVAVRAVGLLASAPDTQDVAAVAARLIRRLDDTNPGVRYAAILALTNLGTGSEEAVPALMTTLRDSSSSSGEDSILLEQSAVFLLGKIGAKAKPAIPVLDTILNDKTSPTRALAGIALWRITHDTNLVFPRLFKMLEETNALGQLQAEAVLRRIQGELQSGFACPTAKP